MEELVRRFGAAVSRAVPQHPRLARHLLHAAYTAFGEKCRLRPRAEVPPPRQSMQWAANRCMARGLEAGRVNAMVNVFLPCELLHAMGIGVSFPEGQATFATCAGADRVFLQAAEDSGVPESYCSYHKLLLGMAETGVLPPPKIILNTTLVCDANQLTFRRLAELWEVPHVTIDVPAAADEAAVSYVAQQLREMALLVQRATGRTLREDALWQALARSRRTLEAQERYFEARATCSLPDEMTSELLSLIATHVLLGTPEAETYFERMAAYAEAQPRARGGVRLLWVHTVPNWQSSLKQVLEHNSRCEIVACDMTFDATALPDPAHPYESMARRVVENSFNGGAERRAACALGRARQLRADGVVWFCHWGCKQTMGAAQLAKRTLEAEGFPVLTLDGDGCDTRSGADGQMLTRLQAFVEQLEGKR